MRRERESRLTCCPAREGDFLTKLPLSCRVFVQLWIGIVEAPSEYRNTGAWFWKGGDFAEVHELMPGTHTHMRGWMDEWMDG